MKMKIVAALVLMVGGIHSSSVFAHCQVPCGIYDDHARVEAMLEDVATIKKAVEQLAAYYPEHKHK